MLLPLKKASAVNLFNIKVSDLLKAQFIITTTNCLDILQKYLKFDRIPASNNESYFRLFEQNKVLEGCFAPAVSPPKKKTHRYVLYKGQRKVVYSKRYDLLRKTMSRARLSRGLGARG
ncbi:hypothetical protein RF11_00960 [Thelohanellus kitauei]|uniref:Uncharacterized protein n=1 Tax=Thelohanellus kitauei TaxID=669202 RepID=A0A0C2MEL0_THEKT|nr:hypothetical protein RF11_00960 [Thelohanellus kitauei]